jgi:hypothetical protein
MTASSKRDSRASPFFSQTSPQTSRCARQAKPPGSITRRPIQDAHIAPLMAPLVPQTYAMTGMKYLSVQEALDVMD